MSINNINFGAKPINNVVLKKYNKRTKQFEDCSANFVKLDPKNYADITAVDSCAENWKYASYIGRIATSSHWMNTLPIEIYALTTQKDNFEKLKSNKILGFAEMREDNRLPKFKWLYYLQVNPNTVNLGNSANKNYKFVGTSIINSLKTIYKNISLFSADSPEIEKFYKDNGFIEDYLTRNHYVWSSNIFTRMKIHIERFRLKYGL